MVKVLAQSKTIECDRAACALHIRSVNLRQILLKTKVDLYNGGTNVINRRGIGSCDTYAIFAVLVEEKFCQANWQNKTLRSLSLLFSHVQPALSRSKWQVANRFAPVISFKF